MDMSEIRAKTADAANTVASKMQEEAQNLANKTSERAQQLSEKAESTGAQDSLTGKTARATEKLSHKTSEAAERFSSSLDRRADDLRNINAKESDQLHEESVSANAAAPVAQEGGSVTTGVQPSTEVDSTLHAPTASFAPAPVQETTVLEGHGLVDPASASTVTNVSSTGLDQTLPTEPAAVRSGQSASEKPAAYTATSMPSAEAAMNLPTRTAHATESTTMPFVSNSASASSTSQPRMAPGGKVRLTNYPTIKNAVLPAEGNGSFNNMHLALLVLLGPAVLLRLIPFVKASWFGWRSYILLVAVLGVPLTIAYWTIMSMTGPRINEKVTLPNRPIEDYLDIQDESLRRKYTGYNKIPMQIFWDAYIDGKIEVKGDLLDVLEYRWDWAAMHFTPELFRYVLFKMLPDVLMHSSRQDEEQIRDNYDRGNDFHEWFLGPQMVYTSGLISDPNREETLEELQDNKMNLVCSKLALKPNDRVLDIGCGWGTLAAFAAKNYGANVTGVTLAREQAAFGNERLQKNGISEDQARILCQDYRDIPVQPGHYNKIVSLEMAEHVGIRHYAKFLKNVYNLLDDDGVMVFQVAGLRPRWQYWDLIWGLFMNKYIFPGADASCPLHWVIGQLEYAGFEVRSCDVVGIHYSATIDRWLKNWKKNEAKVKAKYGDKLYRLWHFFLASSVIIAREGGSSLFQITVTKNLNATHRIEGVESHGNLLPRPNRGKNYQSVY